MGAFSSVLGTFDQLPVDGLHKSNQWSAVNIVTMLLSTSQGFIFLNLFYRLNHVT